MSWSVMKARQSFVTAILLRNGLISMGMKLRNGKEKSMKTDEKGKKLANDILDYVNNLACDEETFANTICHSHRTLQQSNGAVTRA